MSLALRMAAAMAGGAGGDPYWSSVKALLHFDGSNGDTTFTDSKGIHTWIRSGNTIISTGQNMAGFGQAGYFDGTGDYITSTSHADFALAAIDFSIEFFFRLNSTTQFQNLVSNGLAWGANCIGIQYNHSSQPSKISIWLYNVNNASSSLTGTTSISINTWYFLQVVRNGGNLYLYLNGSQDGTSNISTTSIDGGAVRSLVVGSDAVSSAANAYIDEFRFTRGIARLAANPAVPFPNS